MTTLVVFGPIISILWIGFIEAYFIFAIFILSFSMIINIMAGPAYFSLIAEGKLTTILQAHLLISVLNIILGIFLGVFFNGYGVVVSWGCSFIIGSLFLILKYHKDNNLNFKFIISKYNVLFLLISLALGITFNYSILTNLNQCCRIVLTIFFIVTYVIGFTYTNIIFKKTIKTELLKISLRFRNAFY
jgi:hypothetical protein